MDIETQTKQVLWLLYGITDLLIQWLDVCVYLVYQNCICLIVLRSFLIVINHACENYTKRLLSAGIGLYQNKFICYRFFAYRYRYSSCLQGVYLTISPCLGYLPLLSNCGSLIFFCDTRHQYYNFVPIRDNEINHIFYSR